MRSDGWMGGWRAWKIPVYVLWSILLIARMSLDFRCLANGKWDTGCLGCTSSENNVVFDFIPCLCDRLKWACIKAVMVHGPRSWRFEFDTDADRFLRE
jgi:hypothetical protein